MTNAKLAELFGGEKRFLLIRELYLAPRREWTIADIARATSQNTGNVTRWLNRWASLGLVTKTVDGNNVKFQASQDPLLAGLHDIVFRSNELFEDICQAIPKEATVAVVFGSVARGEERAESDIDVLVLGPNLSAIRVGAALRAVGCKHHRTINATVHSEEEFNQLLRNKDGFAKSVVSQKTIALKGELPHDAA